MTAPHVSASDRLDADVLIIGAGMAGASLAFELTLAGQRVLALERESQPGYHTTGRSAALYTPLYGNQPVRALTRASLAFYRQPPPGLCSHPLLTPRGALFYADDSEREAFEAFADETRREIAGTARNGSSPTLPEPRRLSGAALHALAPLLRDGLEPPRQDGGDRRRISEGLLDGSAEDIDVHALLQGYWRLARAGGARLLTGCALDDYQIERLGGRWQLTARRADRPTLRADTIAVCAGAWADPVATLLGLTPLGIAPLRRTAMTFEPAAHPGASPVPADAPMMISFIEDVYLKPDAGRVLLSPADETPSPPCDAQPEELDLALAIDRLMRDTTVEVARVVGRWAGLRSFAHDRSPVADSDPRQPGVFWLVGQGGYGIQMAPALARLAASRLLGRAVPDDLTDQGFDPASTSVGRLLETAPFKAAHGEARA